jgi:hypothetical protein
MPGAIGSGRGFIELFRCSDLNCRNKYDKFPSAGRHGNNAEQNQTCPAALIATVTMRSKTNPVPPRSPPR